MQKNKFILHFLISCILIYIFPIFTFGIIMHEEGLTNVPVKLNQSATIFSVTVPTSLPVNVDDTGKVTVATNNKIINNSFGPVEVKSVEVQSLNDWSIIDFNSDFKGLKVGSKQFGFQLNNTNVETDGSCSATFPIIYGNDETTFTYNAKIVAQKNSTVESIANTIFTMGWYSDLNNNQNIKSDVQFGRPYYYIEKSDDIQNSDIYFYIFYTDGSCNFYTNGQLNGEIPIGTLNYEGSSIFVEDIEMGTVLDKGNQIIIYEEDSFLELNLLPTYTDTSIITYETYSSETNSCVFLDYGYNILLYISVDKNTNILTGDFVFSENNSIFTFETEENIGTILENGRKIKINNTIHTLETNNQINFGKTYYYEDDRDIVSVIFNINGTTESYTEDKIDFSQSWGTGTFISKGSCIISDMNNSIIAFSLNNGKQLYYIYAGGFILTEQ